MVWSSAAMRWLPKVYLYSLRDSCPLTTTLPGLALTAVSDANGPVLFDSSLDTVSTPNQQQGPLPLFEILRQVYDSSILKPVMPYNPNLLISKRRLLACEGGRPAEIRRLVALWWSPSSSDSAPAPMSQSEIE